MATTENYAEPIDYVAAEVPDGDMAYACGLKATNGEECTM